MAGDTTPRKMQNFDKQSDDAPTQSRGDQQYSQKVKLSVATGVFVAICVLACVFIGYGKVSTDDAQVDGRLVAIAPRVQGYICELQVNDNQFVRKGQIIARIEPQDYQLNVNQAAAALDTAEAQAKGASISVPLSAGVTTSQKGVSKANIKATESELNRVKITAQQMRNSDVGYAKANVEEKKANFERAKTDLERMKRLVDKREISRIQFDNYLANYRMADSQLQAATERLQTATFAADAADETVTTAKARLLQAQAQFNESVAQEKQTLVRTSDAQAMLGTVNSARANLAFARLQLSYTEIIAPVDGIVTHRTVEVGHYVSPGQTLLTLVPVHDIWVTANFKETQLKHVHSGQTAKITIDSLGGRTFYGHVDSIASATGSRLSLLPPENATGNFVKIVQRIPVKITLDEMPSGVNLLSVGSNAKVTVYTGLEASSQ